jgi:glycosyltransferase involved in cell wall biosynthesis
MSIYIDISEFLAVPMRTGIQRILGEICRYAQPDVFVPVRLVSDYLVALPSKLITAIATYFDRGDDEIRNEIFRLGSSDGCVPINVSQHDTLLVPEIFGPDRAAFYGRMTEEQLSRCRFIVYDLLPFTHPEYFPPFVPPFLAHYFRIIRRAPHCGFISEDTRSLYYSRLRRTNVNGGVVLPLGSDALGSRASVARLHRALTFTVLGTIEPRKNPDLIFEAFRPVLCRTPDLRLIFMGKMGWVGSKFAREVQISAADKTSGVQHIPTPDDSIIRQHVENSRATIYVSTAEGYGLPPVESLWLGTPVIASRTVPSMQRLGTSGIHYVDSLSVEGIRDAVLAFRNDRYANGKVTEALSMDLPTWRSFSEEVTRWCSPNLG